MNVKTLRKDRPLTSYADLDSFLGDQNERKVTNNTVTQRVAAHAIAVTLHSTDVLTFYRDGRIRLESGGWQTATTKQRINAFLPAGWGVYSDRGVWYVRTPSGRKEFVDGITVTP